MREEGEQIFRELEELDLKELAAEWEKAMLTGIRLILNESLPQEEIEKNGKDV